MSEHARIGNFDQFLLSGNTPLFIDVFEDLRKLLSPMSRHVDESKKLEVLKP